MHSLLIHNIGESIRVPRHTRGRPGERYTYTPSRYTSPHPSVSSSRLRPPCVPPSRGIINPSPPDYALRPALISRCYSVLPTHQQRAPTSLFFFLAAASLSDPPGGPSVLPPPGRTGGRAYGVYTRPLLWYTCSLHGRHSPARWWRVIVLLRQGI